MIQKPGRSGSLVLEDSSPKGMNIYRPVGQPGQPCCGYDVPNARMAQIQTVDIVTASLVADASRLPAVVRNQRSPVGWFLGKRPKCEVRMGSLNEGTIGGDH